MKRKQMNVLWLCFALLSFSPNSWGQAITITDDMQWITPSAVQQTGANFSATSPQLNGCDLTYTISSTGCGFAANTYQPVGGITLPANHNACTDLEVQYTITFSEEVTDLRIHVYDFDEIIVPGASGSPEHLKFFGTPNELPDFVTGDLFLQTNPTNKIVTADNNSPVVNDDASGWIVWNGPVQTITFSYMRPYSGYVVFIDEMQLTHEPTNTASVEPVSHLGFTNVPSQYGPLEVARFCKDEVVLDGSATYDETDYHLSLSVLNPNPWSTTPLYSDWFSGQAPSNIDLSAFALVPGVVYTLSLSTGPCWTTDNLFFVVEDCCPEELELVIDCDNEIIAMANIPNNISNVETTWIYTDANNVSTVIAYGQFLIPAVPHSHGFGMYTALITFNMPNGIECELQQSTYLSKDYCCKVNGPDIDLTIDPNNIVGNYYEPNAYYGPMNIPIIDCQKGMRYLMEFNCFESTPASVYMSIEEFDVINWTPVPNGFVYSTNNYTSIPTGSPSPFASALDWTPQQEYLITICAGGVCEYLIFRINGNCPGNTKKSAIGTAISNIDEMTLTPNPGKEMTTVQFGEVLTGELEVRSMDGKIIHSEEVEEMSSVRLDLSNFAKGMYLVTFSNSNTTLSTKLLKE